MSGLTDKQTLFINSYLVHFNATRAAIEAGYSEDTAYNIGWENVRKPEIKAVIDERIKEIISQTDDKRAFLIRFWVDIINDPESSENGKLKASENLAKYLAMFTERVEHSGSLTVDNTVFVVETSEIS